MEDQQTSNGLLLKDEAAKYLRISVRGMEHWMKVKRVPYVKIGRLVRFRRSDLDAVLARNVVNG